MINPKKVQKTINEASACYARTEKSITELQLVGAEVARLAGIIARRFSAREPISDAEFADFRAAVQRQVVQLDSLTENTRRAAECCTEFLKAAEDIHALWKLM